MEQLCASLNINKKSVDRDLDVYRNLLSKLVQAKELLKEYVERYCCQSTSDSAYIMLAA